VRFGPRTLRIELAGRKFSPRAPHPARPFFRGANLFFFFFPGPKSCKICKLVFVGLGKDLANGRARRFGISETARSISFSRKFAPRPRSIWLVCCAWRMPTDSRIPRSQKGAGSAAKSTRSTTEQNEMTKFSRMSNARRIRKRRPNFRHFYASGLFRPFVHSCFRQFGT